MSTEARVPHVWSPMRRLEDRDNRDDFDCEVEELNRYIHERASQDVKRGVGAVYVLPGPDVAEGQRRSIVGFYTLSASAIPLTEIPPDLAKKLPRYPVVPAFLIGRLAIDKAFKRQGYGGLLVHNALRRCAGLSDEAGAAFVIVDAKNKEVAAWYTSLGFIPTVGDELRLVLPLSTIKKVRR